MAKGFSLQETSNLSDEEKINYFRGLPGFGEIEDQIRARDWDMSRAEFEVHEDVTEGRRKERERKAIAQRLIEQREAAGLVYDSTTNQWIDAETARQRTLEKFGDSKEAKEALSGFGRVDTDKTEQPPDDPRVPWERPPLDPIQFDIDVPDVTLPGPFDVLGAEAEIGTAAVTKHEYGGGSFILDLLKIGQDVHGIGKSSPEALRIIEEMGPFAEGELSVEESIKRLRELNDARSFGDQLATGAIVPTNMLGVVPLKHVKMVKAVNYADNAAVFRQIIEKIPETMTGYDEHVKNTYTAIKEQMLNRVMNKPIPLEGVPENSFYEMDLRLWVNMPKDDVINVSRYADEVTSNAGAPGALHMAELETSLERLTDLGLVTKDGPNYTKRVLSGSPEAIEILDNYGKVIGVGGGSDGVELVKPLRSMETVIEEIVTVENPALSKFLKDTGINPSVAATTEVEKAVIAYARQNSSINELIEVALQGGLDYHAATRSFLKGKIVWGTGKMPVAIDKDGVVEGTGTLWMDVFSDPDAFISKTVDGKEIEILSKEALEYMKSYRKIVNEMESLRVAAGLDPLSKDRDGWYYIPRQVLGVDDIEFLRKSNFHLERTFDTATEGRLGIWDEELHKYVNEVNYQVDPRSNLRVHMKAAYHEILDSQLSDYLAAKKVAFAPTDILEKRYPKVYKRYEIADKNLKNAKRDLKRLSQQLHSHVSTRPSEGTVADRLAGRITSIQEGAKARKALEESVNEARVNVKKAQGEFNAARSQRARRLEKIRKDDTLPGSLWGDIGDAPVAVRMWKNRIYKSGDFEALSAGIDNIAGDSRGWARVGGRFIDTSRWLQSNGDFGVQFIQGLVMLARNPVKWSKATGVALQAFTDPAVQARFVNQNLATFQEMAQYGVPLGDVEFFAAMQKGRGLSPGALIDLLPHEEGALLFGREVGDKTLAVGRGGQAVKRGGKITQDRTFGRFQATYGMFLAMSRAMLWKSMRNDWVKKGRKGNTLSELGAYIRNMTGGLDSKALGVASGRREVEGAWLAFSPRLLRSTIALVGDAMAYVPAETGKLWGGSGATARQAESARAIGTFLTGVHVLYAAAAVSSGVAKGHSGQRILNDMQEGLNPLNGSKYLSIDINGQSIGVGGQVRALVQFQMALVATLAPGGPPIGDLLKLNTRDNPILRFLAFRGALAPEIAGTFIEGLTPMDALPFDAIDSPVDIVQHLLTSSLPFAIQGAMEGDTALGVLGLTGLRTSPVRPSREEELLIKDGFYKMSPDELEAYDHKANDFPSNWRSNLNRKLRDELTEKNPDIELAREKNLELQVELGGDYGIYRNSRNANLAKRDTFIENIRTTMSHNPKKMRAAITRAYIEYAKESAILNNKYEDMLEEFDELDGSENPFNKAEDRYWEVMTAEEDDRPSLVDPTTLEYNYAERDARLEELRNDPLVGPYFDEVRAHILSKAPPLVQELTRDRNFLEPYWTITEKIGEELNFTEKHKHFREQTPDNQSLMRKGEVENLNWTIQDVFDLQVAIERIQTEKEKLRETDMDSPENAIYEALLYKWGYIDTPTNFDVMEWVIQMQNEQGGAVIDRLQIEAKIEAYAAEQGISRE